MLEEIRFFEDLLQTPGNHLIDAAVAENRIPIGYNCYVVPRPLLSVGNLFPVRLRAPGVQNTELADFYLSSVLCSFSRSILETALTGGYHFLGGLVNANSCQHSTRCGQHFEIKNINADNDNFFVHILETPRKTYPEFIEVFIKDLKRTASIIADKYQVDMSDAELSKAIKQHNEFNRMLQEIADLRKATNPRISGSEFHKLMAATLVAPQDKLIQPIKNLKEALQQREGITDYRARIMVVGPCFDNPQLVELMEEQGALLACDRFCFGSLPGLEEIPEDGDPYQNLAEHYLATCECPRMIEKAETRTANLIRWAREYAVDGIVFLTIKFCDMWGYEKLITMEAVREAGIPIISIEREYGFAGEGQFRTRIQAFIESIENKNYQSEIRGEQVK